MRDNTIEEIEVWFKYKGRLYMTTIEQSGVSIMRKDGQVFNEQEVYAFVHGRIKRLLKKYRP